VAVQFSSTPWIGIFDTTRRSIRAVPTPVASVGRKHQQLSAVSIYHSRMPMKPMRFDPVCLRVA